MRKLVAFYLFSEATSSVALERLRRLRAINSNVTFIPAVGVRQFLFLPALVDEYMFGTTKTLRFIGPIAHFVNSTALSAPGFFKFSAAINKTVGAFTSRSKLIELRSRVQEEGLQTLYADFTPMVLFNCDRAIMNWFNTAGKWLDFDYLIFYESDIYTTKPLDAIYGAYAETYDACFNGYGSATKGWYFYNYPVGCNWATRRWLKRRKLPTTLYNSIFGGCLISRYALERLVKLKIDFSGEPYCFAEMRLPTILTAIGFKVGRLNFPFYRYRPVWSEEELYRNKDAGIFHPVKTLTSAEKE